MSKRSEEMSMPAAQQPGVLDGLTSNLIAEFVGIVVTVLIIDRIIRHREELRWDNVRGLVLFKTVAYADSLLHSLLLALGPAKDESGQIVEPAQVPLNPANLATFVRRQVMHLNGLPQGLGELLRQDLQALLTFVPFIKSPDLVSLLINLDRQLELLAHTEPVPPDQNSREALAGTLMTCVGLASYLKIQAAKEGYSDVLTVYRLAADPLRSVFDRTPITIAQATRLSVPKAEAFLYERVSE
jgi:hypothetical protein